MVGCIRSITIIDNIRKAQVYFISFGYSFTKIFERNALPASQEKRSNLLLTCNYYTNEAMESCSNSH